MLKTVISDLTELVFVSERNKSLIKVIAEVYLMPKHEYCIWHLSHNVKGHVKYGRDEVAEQFRKLHKFIQRLSLNSSIKSLGRVIHGVLRILIKVSMSKIGRSVISPVQGTTYTLLIVWSL